MFVSCIPLHPHPTQPPALSPTLGLCCKQSLLPPFILVKSFQIYYVLHRRSAGPWLECRPRFAVCALPAPPRSRLTFSVCFESARGADITEGQGSASREEVEGKEQNKQQSNVYFPCNVMRLIHGGGGDFATARRSYFSFLHVHLITSSLSILEKKTCHLIPCVCVCVCSSTASKKSTNSKDKSFG